MARKQTVIFISLTLAVAGLVVYCASSAPVPHKAQPGVSLTLLPGGEGSVETLHRPSFMRPMANLAEGKKSNFYAGRALAQQPWVKAPTATHSRDGLGPVFNARSCLACHANGGRGRVPDSPAEPVFSSLVRLSLPGYDAVHGVVPEPVYGDQFQPQSTSLASQLGLALDGDDPGLLNPPAEGNVRVSWSEEVFTYPDGSRAQLRQPTVTLENLGYGALHVDTLKSLRISPPVHGMGLLEAIAEADILAKSDPQDADGDGISGRPNRVWDIAESKMTLGRFGWKATQPSIRQQTATAFLNDIGITNPLFPEQPCTAAQLACNNEITGNEWDEASQKKVELAEHMLQMTVDFTQSMAVPRRHIRNEVAFHRGRDLFFATGCYNCHTPSYTTGQVEGLAHLSEQKIWPYTDLLLHDMGEGLADGRPEFEASGSEWRTPPLWGLGLNRLVNGNAQLLHDGRARTVEEAILWHGGEAAAARDKFVTLNKEQRKLLIQFVNSL